MSLSLITELCCSGLILSALAVFIDYVTYQVAQFRPARSWSLGVIFAHAADTNARELMTQTNKALVWLVKVIHRRSYDFPVRPFSNKSVILFTGAAYNVWNNSEPETRMVTPALNEAVILAPVNNTILCPETECAVI